MMIKYVLVMGDNWFQMADDRDALPIISGCHIERWIYMETENGHYVACKRRV